MKYLRIIFGLSVVVLLVSVIWKYVGEQRSSESLELATTVYFEISGMT